MKALNSSSNVCYKGNIWLKLDYSSAGLAGKVTKSLEGLEKLLKWTSIVFVFLL